jgi:hypothetical protein
MMPHVDLPLTALLPHPQELCLARIDRYCACKGRGRRLKGMLAVWSVFLCALRYNRLLK